MPSKPKRALSKTPKPVRRLGMTGLKRLAGLRPGMVGSVAAAATAGLAVAVLTYRVLRSE